MLNYILTFRSHGCMCLNTSITGFWRYKWQVTKFTGWRNSLAEQYMSCHNTVCFCLEIYSSNTLAFSMWYFVEFSFNWSLFMLQFFIFCHMNAKVSLLHGSEWNRLNFRGRLFVQFSDRWSTHNRLFYSTVRKYIMKHFPGWSICQSVRITVFPTFRTYQKHSLPVNMAVDINKPKFVTNLIIYQRKVKEIA